MCISNSSVIRDEDDMIQEFIGVQNNKIGVLFVKDTCKGKGLGRHLVNWAINTLNIKFVGVKEQNEQGLDKYGSIKTNIEKLYKNIMTNMLKMSK